MTKDALPVGALRARVASMDPVMGTVYQIDVPWPSEFGVDEDRVFVMHDPRHGWRFLAVCPGEIRANWGNREVTTSITWTGNPRPGDENQPVQIDYVAKETQKPTQAVPRPVPIYWHGTYERDTIYPRDSTHYVLVEPGDSFEELSERLALMRGYGRPLAPAALDEFRKKIRALNVKVAVDSVKPGDQMVIPEQ